MKRDIKVKALIKKLEKQRDAISRTRDQLNTLLDEAQALDENCFFAENDLTSAIDTLSQYA